MVAGRHQDQPEELKLVQAVEQELLLIDELPTIGLPEAMRRHRTGATLWLGLDADRPAFACWTFAGRAPVPAAPEGLLELPHRVAALDDVVIDPAYRGLGLAPRALARIADFYASRGLDSIVAKADETDKATRRCLEQAEFEHLGQTRMVRVGPFKRVRFEPSSRDAPSWLTAALLGQQPPRSERAEPASASAPGPARSPLGAGTRVHRHH
jgi:GNAT superfamily N-acetyltransferase